MGGRIIENYVNHYNLEPMRVHVKSTFWTSVFKKLCCYVRFIILVTFFLCATSFLYLNYSLDSCKSQGKTCLSCYKASCCRNLIKQGLYDDCTRFVNDIGSNNLTAGLTRLVSTFC